jgi:hypothetical protein
MKTAKFCFLFIVSFICIQLCAQKTISSLKFLSGYEVPFNQQFKNTTIGGLSGIDYDTENDCYYLISDDRSAINPARFYTAKFFFNQKKIDSVVFVDVKNMFQANGIVYPNAKQNAAHTPDPEAIRYNPKTKQFIWTSEGERIVKSKDTILENPAITIISTNGKFVDTIPLPQNLYMHASEKGPRQNGVLEGATFSNDYKTLFVNVEEPLYEDGERADTKPNDAWIRLFAFKTTTQKNVAQYAYHLEPVAHETILPGTFKINGVPDILWLNKHQLLVMERSFSTGTLPCTIKIFIADITKATNILNNHSLKKETDFIPASKKLLLNMDDLGMYIDNVEGMTFGPTLPNGHKTLVMVSDNNFAAFQKTQFFVFEVIP